MSNSGDENKKRLLVIGNGGREHAICWKLSQSESVEKIYALPGSFGIACVPKCENLKGLDLKDFESIAIWCKNIKVDMVIVGPEDPLANGLADALLKLRIRCFGPTKQGAQIEADKKWAKDFMLRHGIPTARYESFTDVDKAKIHINNAPYKALVVKAAGLAAGKGVIVATNTTEACEAAEEILGQRKFGSAGETLVIEELLMGEEISVLAFVDTKTVRVMLPAQDHKRLLEHDEGPNTGGMGAYCPCPLINERDLKFVAEEVIQKAVDGLRKENIKYCGVLYAGIMLTSDGPKVLEFNCRFGDPETQVILPLMKSDLYEVMSACCDGRLNEIRTLEWRDGLSAVGVVMASAGYPETSTKGSVITGIPPNTETQLIFQSGVAINSKGIYLTNGGRVLIAVALREALKGAATAATKICQQIKFSGAGAQFRMDIAEKAFRFQKNAVSLSYKDSGVDIDAGDNLVQRIKPLARGTQRAGVLGGLGGFGGLFRLRELNYKNPVICEATQGVGSKIQLSIQQNMYESIGYDLVAMCVNDVLESGAEPIAFLDYIACGKLQVPVAAQIVKGISEGCRYSKCALLGGETAEMPTVYEVGKYDIAGYCVGVVEDGHELPKFDEYEEGDLLISLPSNGLHCAGFNSILELLYALEVDLDQPSVFGDKTKTLGQQLAVPSRIYVPEVLQLIREDHVRGVAHVTTGLLHDVRRIMPADFEISIDFGDLKVPDVFGWLAAELNLSPETLLENTNCGIGMVLIVPKCSKSWKKILTNAKVFGVLKRKIPLHAQEMQVEVKNFNEAIEKLMQKFGAFGDSIGTKTLNSEMTNRELKHIFNATCDETRPEAFKTYLGRWLHRVEITPDNDPILVIGTDGVGTKIKIAQQTGRNNTVGVDLVAMCVNDILCNGAKPLTFSSYYACGELNEDRAKSIMTGVQEGAKQANCSLVETHIAEVPLLYQPEVYDLAGFSLGIANRLMILPSTDTIIPGDVLIGLPSSGIHSNGFSLVHAVMKVTGVNFQDKAPFSSKTFGEEFLTPTKIYVESVTPLIEKGLIKAIAHITGGGLTENIPRVLTSNLAVKIDSQKFIIPPVFGWLAKFGNISPTEMLRTFNCGIGLVLVVDKQKADEVLSSIKFKEHATIIGAVVQRESMTLPQVIVENFDNRLHAVQQMLCQPRKRVAVLISGSGTNLQALINASRNSAHGLHSDIVLVISNKPDVMGLERAKRAGIRTEVILHKVFKVREDFDQEVNRVLVKERVDLVCLAGFMRVLSEQFVKQWRGRLINIHPSLLPKHPGLHVQQKALEAGDKESGCTVHFVDEGVDTGAIIVQERVPIFEEDSVETLAERIHHAEHYAFPQALRLLATKVVKLSADGKAVFS